MNCETCTRLQITDDGKPTCQIRGIVDNMHYTNACSNYIDKYSYWSIDNCMNYK